MQLNWNDIEQVVESGVNALLYGPPGTGKTRCATNGDSYSITLTMETPAAELRGHFVPEGTKFVWFDGPAIRAWREGKRIVLNEIDQASGDAMTFLHALLDDPAVARLTLPNGETVTPKKGFQAVATTNAMDLPMVLPEALLDRFAVRIKVMEPHPQALAELGNRVLAELVTRTIGKAPEARVSLRQAIAFQRLAKEVGAETAASAILGSVLKDATMLAAVVGAGK